MGFKQPQRKAHVVFEDGDYAGLELTLSLDEPIGRFLAVERMVASGNTRLEEIGEMLSALILDWNLEDDQGSVPITKEGIERLSVGTIIVILTKWMEVQTGPPVPLGAQLNNGSGLEVASIPMESLSPGPGS